MSVDEIKALDTSDVGLVEEELQDGSVMIDLQGRFHSTEFATVDNNGKVKISHEQPNLQKPSNQELDDGGSPKQGGK